MLTSLLIAGTVPLGLDSLNPAGSCAASPDGPVTDGQQLNKLVQSPGTGNTGGNGNGNDGGNKTTPAPEPTTTPAPEGGNAAETVTVTQTQVRTVTVTAGGSGATPTSTNDDLAPAASAEAAKPFQRQNGLDAQQLNRSFDSLTADSPCNDGEQACVEGGFAQCVGGAFQITQCSGGTQCFALPLVNKAGTSLTCDTEADAAARIAATGATGGIRG